MVAIVAKKKAQAAPSTKQRKTERQRDAERKRLARRSDRDLTIPKIANPGRRRRCEKNIFLWLRTYFPDAFYQDFTEQQRSMVSDILFAAKYGGDKAVAAPRSDGKTTIAECVILFCVITGLLKFPLIAAATGPDAARILDHMKGHLERNDTLAADYPEVCFPIRALEGAPQRAGSQTVGGKRTWLEWKQDYVVLPTVRTGRKPSRASGAVIMTRGLDAAIRGVRVGVVRPDFVLVDDPETRESVKSEEQTKTRRLTIEQDLAGLGGGDKQLARVILTTIMRRTTEEGGPTISFEYTDPKQKPSWQGSRFKLLLKESERPDLVDEYLMRREADFAAGDKHARKSHAWYIENRELIELGAEVSNPSRFNSKRLPDGSQAEVSAIQRCYNIIADRGLEHFQTEYQNDPPVESGPIESGITASRIQRQLSGYPRKIVPQDCRVVVQGIDVGKVLLHWVVRAWRPDGTGFTIDRDTTPVHGTVIGSDDGLDIAIIRAIKQRMAEIEAEPYRKPDGEIVPVALTLIDCGYRTAAIYQACREFGRILIPAMGFGKSAGCTQANFSRDQKPSDSKYVGDGWTLVEVDRINWPGIWRANMEADKWKAWEHDRWMTDPAKPGCMFLYGDSSDDPRRLSSDERDHMTYAKQIVAEIEIEEVHKGVLRRRWHSKSDKNHFLDASYMCDVAANMKGIRLLRDAVTVAVKPAQSPKPADTKPHETEDRPFLASLR